MNLRDDNSFAGFPSGGRHFAGLGWLVFFGWLAVAHAGEPVTARSGMPSALGQLPLRFEAGASDAGSPTRFFARGPAYHLSIAPTEAVLSVRKFNPEGASSPGPAARGAIAAPLFGRQLRLEFVGADERARIEGVTELPGRVNYFLGNDPARWRTGVPTFARVRVRDLYPGINLIHYGNQERLEYDFVVSPGGEPSLITIRFSGADKVSLDSQGDLVLSLGADEIRQPRPVVYQAVAGGRRPIAGGYSLVDAATVKFTLGPYDHRLPLVIDPVLSYATYYGGSGLDMAWGVAVDTNGFVYVAGETMAGLPVTGGALTNRYGGARSHGDAFVAKFDNRAAQVIYLSYVGGSLDDVAFALAVDKGGNAYLTGYTDSTDFPTKSAIFNHISGIPYPDPVNIYPVDGFVMKLGPLGTNLIYSTFLGGGWVDVGTGIAVDEAGCAYVAGYTQSTNFPVANASGSFTNYGGRQDAFVSKIGPAGTNLVYSLYLGGAENDAASGIAADVAGRAYVTGHTTSTNFPTTPNAVQPWPAGDEDAFVTALGSSGTNLLFSTYLGGAGKNRGSNLALDAAANIYVTGYTKEDSTFPVTPGPLNPGGIFLSGDGGTSWNASSSGLQSVAVYALAVDPNTPTRVYAGTSRGVVWSTNGGVTWNSAVSTPATSAGLAPAIVVGSVLSLAVDPVGPTNVYAGTAEGVFKSLDAGLRWFLSSPALGLVATRAIAVDPVTPEIVYAGNDLGVYRSTNGAANWSDINNGLGNIFVRGLAVDPVTPTTIYAATAGGVYRTRNSGSSWFSFSLGLSNLSAQAIVIDPATPASLYVGTPDGVFNSGNAGTNWTALNVGLTTRHVLALAIDPLTPTTLYAGTTNGLFKSLDGGATWNAMTNGLTVSRVSAVQPNPLSPATVYAGTTGRSFVFGGKDVFLTRLGGAGFSVVLGGGLDDEGRAVTVAPSGGIHFVGTTSSKDFPTTNTFGAISATNSGLQDVLVAEVSPDGNTLVDSAYVGGWGNDSGNGIALDAAGNLYVVGDTDSPNFPTTIGALQKTYAGGLKDAFLAKIGNPAFQPTLAIQAAASEVRLSWSALAAEYGLQSNTNLLVANGWRNVSNSPVQTNAVLTVSLPATNDVQFFRLSNQ